VPILKASYIFKRPYAWEKVPRFNARINQGIDHGRNWNDSDVLYSKLQTILQREESSAVAPHKTFFSNLIDCMVIGITHI
jgi:hypothetical protein